MNFCATRESRPRAKAMPIEICQLYISAGHNFFGHHGREPDQHLAIEVQSVDCIAGRGIRDDRFLDYKKSYKGQITFFAVEVLEELCRALNIPNASPSSLRRNRQPVRARPGG